MADLEARLRIVANAAQAVRELRKVSKATTDAGAAISKAPLEAGFAKTAAAAERAAVAAEKAAARTAAAAEKAAVAKERADARAAASGTASAEQAAAAAERTAQRTAAAAARAAQNKERLDARAVRSGEAAAAAAAAAAARQSALSTKAADQAAQAKERLDAKAVARATESARRVSDIERKAAREKTRQAGLLAPQLTDIFTGLAGGQNPLLVAIQQGGQLRDIYGGVGNAVRQIASAFTPVRVAAGGVAAIAGLIAFQIFKGYSESQRLAKSFALTGNTANITATTIDRATAAIAKNADVTVGVAREAATAVAATGQFAEGNVVRVGQAIAAINKLSGASVEETLKQFTDLTQNTSQGAAAMNRAYSFLTVDQFKYIRTLEAQGRAQEAIKFITDQLNGTLQQRSVGAIGELEGAWSKVGKVLSSVLGWFQKIGADTTAEEKLDQLAAKLERLRALTQQESPESAPSAPGREDVQTEIVKVEQERDAFNRSLLNRAERAATQATANAEIEKLSEKHQKALSQIEDAATALRLARALQAIEARSNALETANARGLLGEQEYSRQVNALALERLKVEESAARARIAAAAKDQVKGGTTPEQVAIRARVTQLQASLVEVQTRIKAAEAKGVQDTSRLTLEEAREQAREYAEVWSRAYSQIRTFALEAQAIRNRQERDPTRRAQADADAATNDARAELASTRGALQNRIDIGKDEGQKTILRAQLAELLRTADQVIAERTRGAVFQSLQQQSETLQAQLAARVAQITERQNAGLINGTQAEQEILDVRREQVPVLERILELLRQTAVTDEEQLTVANSQARLTALRDYRTELQRTVQQNGIDELAGSFNRATLEGQSFWDSMRQGLAGFGRSLVELINQRLAAKLVAQFVDAAGSASQSSDNGWLGMLLKLVFSGAASGGSKGYSSAGIADTTGGAGGYQKGGARLALNYIDGNAGALGKRSSASAAAGRASAGLASSTAGGGVTLNSDVTINAGAGASSGADSNAQRNAGQQLQTMIKATVSDWAIDQSRPGGMLYKGAR